MPKTSQQCGQSEKNPSESIGRDPPGDGAYCDRKRSQSISRLASRQTAAILSGIIINKNLKLLLINYLARKVDILFHFPSRSQYTWDRTYGRTVYTHIHTHTYIMHTYTYTHRFLHNAYIYINTYKCSYIHTYITYIHTYIHTYTHTYIIHRYIFTHT